MYVLSFRFYSVNLSEARFFQLLKIINDPVLFVFMNTKVKYSDVFIDLYFFTQSKLLKPSEMKWALSLLRWSWGYQLPSYT